MVVPSRDTNWRDFLVDAERGKADLDPARMNRLIYGDNLLAMAALLAGDDDTPSYRGKVDLIYIDPPFDSKADYRTKITLPGGDLEQKPTVLEQFAYSDTWQDDTASYLRMIVPRLALARELLSDAGSIYVHLDYHVSHYVKIALDELFTKQNFLNEIIWKREGGSALGAMGRLSVATDSLLLYSKEDNYIFNTVYQPAPPDYIEQQFRYNDPDGRRFMITVMRSPNPRPNLMYDYKGYKNASKWLGDIPISHNEKIR